jgi:hypothetical protein
MHFREHNPPHFHARYNDFEASIFIDTLGVMQGELPPRVLSLVIEWAMLHQSELRANWDSLRASGEFRRMQPLV